MEILTADSLWIYKKLLTLVDHQILRGVFKSLPMSKMKLFRKIVNE